MRLLLTLALVLFVSNYAMASNCAYNVKWSQVECCPQGQEATYNEKWEQIDCSTSTANSCAYNVKWGQTECCSDGKTAVYDPHWEQVTCNQTTNFNLKVRIDD